MISQGVGNESCIAWGSGKSSYIFMTPFCFSDTENPTLSMQRYVYLTLSPPTYMPVGNRGSCQYKGHLFGTMISIIKVRPSWDRLIFMMRIPKTTFLYWDGAQYAISVHPKDFLGFKAIINCESAVPYLPIEFLTKILPNTISESSFEIRIWWHYGMQTLSALKPSVIGIYRSLVDSPHKGPIILSCDAHICAIRPQWVVHDHFTKQPQRTRWGRGLFSLLLKIR